MTHPDSNAITPGRLAQRTAIYYVALLAALVATLKFWPDAARYLPVGGHDALAATGVTSAADLFRSSGNGPPVPRVAATDNHFEAVRTIMLFLTGHLTGTILAMLPVSWTYKAINYEAGFRRNFVRALLLLPICATTIVLLIQDSLALAFGLAALVAAVRFRVALDEAIDGIFIFAAVCVGLAAGIGYLGIALVMSMFFCFASIVMWATDYGRNPVDDARRARKIAKQDKSASTDATSP